MEIENDLYNRIFEHRKELRKKKSSPLHEDITEEESEQNIFSYNKEGILAYSDVIRSAAEDLESLRLRCVHTNTVISLHQADKPTNHILFAASRISRDTGLNNRGW